MAGTKGRSGRREIIPTSVDLPPFTNDVASIIVYLDAVRAAVVAGDLDPRTAEPLIACARVALQALKHQHSRADIDEVKALYEAAKSLAREGVEHEVADRRHQKKKPS